MSLKLPNPERKYFITEKMQGFEMHCFVKVISYSKRQIYRTKSLQVSFQISFLNEAPSEKSFKKPDSHYINVTSVTR